MRGPLVDESLYQDALLEFWDRSNVLGEDECWPWPGWKTKLGYGRFRHKMVVFYAHRVAYYAFHGRLPDGEIDHLCRNTSCTNPRHIEDVMHKTNMDRSPYMHKDFCIRGHAMTGDNLYIKWYRHASGCMIEKHICKACRRDRAHARGGWRR